MGHFGLLSGILPTLILDYRNPPLPTIINCTDVEIVEYCKSRVASNTHVNVKKAQQHIFFLCK